MSWELRRFNWSILRAAGDASHVPAAIFELERAATPAEAVNAYWKIDNTIIVQGALYEAALAGVPALVSSLLRCTECALPEVLELLVQIGAGEVSPVEILHGNLDLAAACQREVARGFPIYVGLLEHSASVNVRRQCIDLLGISTRSETSLNERVSAFFAEVKAAERDDGLLQLIESWEEEVTPKPHDNQADPPATSRST